MTDDDSRGQDSEPAEALRRAIVKGTVTVGIVALGYVGLPLALTFAVRGLPVLGFDIEGNKVETLNAGGSHIDHWLDEVVFPTGDLMQRSIIAMRGVVQ